MKYIRWVFIILFLFVRKVVGLVWFYVALPFRAYARNVVHNYSLQGKLYIPILTNRPITEEDDRYVLAPFHDTQGGYIKKRKISWIEFQLVFWILWGWLDDCSNHDTMSGFERPGMFYGNSFDLGDKRGEYPEFNFKESTAWLWRNTAYNFKYVLHECLEGDKNFFYKRFTTKYFDWHFGFLPAESELSGRLVYFNEYISKAP